MSASVTSTSPITSLSSSLIIRSLSYLTPFAHLMRAWMSMISVVDGVIRDVGKSKVVVVIVNAFELSPVLVLDELMLILYSLSYCKLSKRQIVVSVVISRVSLPSFASILTIYWSALVYLSHLIVIYGELLASSPCSILSSSLIMGRKRASALGRSSSSQLTNVPNPIVIADSSKNDLIIFFMFFYL